MFALLRPALVSTVILTLLLGVAYPLAITAAAQAAFPQQAQGSLVRDRHGGIVGSQLLAQAFTRPAYLHPRPSAAGSDGYDASGSSGSNMGPLNPDLAKRVMAGASAVRGEDGAGVIPADAVTASGSGLDPDISPAYARLQAGRIASSRGVNPAAVSRLIEGQVQPPLLGFLGQPRVNVLKTNLALDAAFGRAEARPR